MLPKLDSPPAGRNCDADKHGVSGVLQPGVVGPPRNVPSNVALDTLRRPPIDDSRLSTAPYGYPLW